jgi:AcrR family transcriptional regulator
VLDIPNRDRRAERREATRQEILDAAWEFVRAEGLAALSLRDLARRVGMQAPSLYSYFDSKHAIYDAMFAEGCREFLERSSRVPVTDDLLVDLTAGMRHFVGFCTEDPARYQLMFQRTIPGFEPSPETYAIAVEALGVMHHRLATHGITDPASLDLITAVSTGLTDQQISNDPGGDRWVRLVDDAAEMLHRHLTAPRTARTTRQTRGQTKGQTKGRKGRG